MAAKREVGTLTDEARAQLWALTTQGRGAARRLTRAHSLLHADAGATQDATAAALHIGRATVVRICRRVVEAGLERLPCGTARARAPSARWRASRKPSSWP